jgi:hypothetical protein
MEARGCDINEATESPKFLRIPQEIRDILPIRPTVLYGTTASVYLDDGVSLLGRLRLFTWTTAAREDKCDEWDEDVGKISSRGMTASEDAARRPPISEE